jgi:hypothetical protein
MARLEWDKVGERFFETGVDRGVLYLPSGVGVPWNGLSQVTENKSREVKSYYLDGVKYLDHFVPGAYAAQLQAFTYPDELDMLLGNTEFAPGVVLHDQQAKPFSLSYRTRLGNDLEGVEYGYRLHIVYNVTASPSGGAMVTLGDRQEASAFTWDLTAVPSQMFGIRPTAHVSLVSTAIDELLLGQLEDALYGSVGLGALLPDFIELMDMVGNPSVIVT